MVTRIPDGIWRQMTGRTWHRGCPDGRAGLRLVRVNYWGYDGYRYRGELIAAASAAPRMAGALAEMYAKRFPIRSIYRVDRFGWSKRLCQRHSHPLVAWRSRSHPVVRIMARHGLRWTYGLGDTQHFDTTHRHGRVPVYPGCERVRCD